MFIMCGLALNNCVCAVLLIPFKETKFTINDDIDIVDIEIREIDQHDVEANRSIASISQTRLNGFPRRYHNGNSKPTSPLISRGKLDNIHIEMQPRTFADLRREQLSLWKSSPSGSFRSLSPSLNPSAVVQGSHQSLSRVSQLSHGSRRNVNMAILSQTAFGSNASFEYLFNRRTKSRSSNINISQPLIVNQSTNITYDTAKGNGTSDKFSAEWLELMFPKVLVKNPNYILMLSVCLFAGVGSFIPFSMLPDFALSVGCPVSQSAWPLSAIGVGGT